MAYLDQLGMIFELGVQQYRDSNREQDAIQWIRDTLTVLESTTAKTETKERTNAFVTEQAERVGLRI